MGSFTIPQGVKRKLLRPFTSGSNYVEITLPELLPERMPPLPFFSTVLSIHHIINQIILLGEENWIDGIILKLGTLKIELSRLPELYQALKEFKNKGKRIIVYLHSGETSHYLLASLGDLVVMNPGGSIFLPGFRAELIYFRDALKKIGVKPEFERIGRYKSTPEMFTRNSLSQPHREEIQSILNETSDFFYRSLQQNRGLSPAVVQKVTRTGILTAPEALTHKLVDALGFPDEIPHFARERFNDKAVIIPPGEVPPSLKLIPRRSRVPKLAVVFVEGMIRSGENVEDPVRGTVMTGAETISSVLSEVARDRSIFGAVLRIDSGGGSAEASDEIWRAVTRLREKKPVVVSCGGIAASGGYYVACGANENLSNPLTLTGSIGVFFGKFVIRDLLERYGVNPTIVKKGQRADIMSSFRTLTKEEHTLLRRHLEHTYRNMLDRVGEGRNIKSRTLSRAAEGRVWTGSQAIEMKLVDHLGGMSEAIRRVKELSGISPDRKVPLVELPRRRSWRREIIRGMLSGGYMGRGRFSPVFLSPFLPVAGNTPPAFLHECQDVDFLLSLFRQPQPLMLSPYQIVIR